MFFEEDDDEKEPQRTSSEALSTRLLKARTVLVTGEVNHELAERVISQLLILDSESRDPIRVIITSNGGHVESGFAIHDVMRFVESKVIAIGAGWVVSIAVPILFGASKENRLALPNTRFMIHQPMGGVGGQATDVRIAAQEILKIRERINRLISEETGQPLDKIVADSDRNFWLSAEEAKEYGLISRIVSSASEVG
ncbi:MAG: ATP-dependent Clp protease proteolytic subunit [Candidatus Omnitrophica bacterium]|nr:ATP-dependent Clp protease proteolytic subunit [bacterium]NUN96087.1 ATP-dependent Clp protease proteolytic subunit [Candidatus Omnitrophota bacterium]